MIGRIIGIKVIKTTYSEEPPIIAGRTMISDRTEKTTCGMTNIQHANMKGMVYLLVDCSGSMEGYKLELLRYVNYYSKELYKIREFVLHHL